MDYIAMRYKECSGINKKMKDDLVESRQMTS